jgi:hypothetical protein
MILMPPGHLSLGSRIRFSLSLGSGLQLRLYKGANIEVKIEADLEIGPRRLFRSELRYACYTTNSLDIRDLYQP